MKGYLGTLSDAVLGRIGNDILAGIEAGSRTLSQDVIALATIKGETAWRAFKKLPEAATKAGRSRV